MKYEEIVGLYEYFQPVYDITYEPKDYWKQFIPTKYFLDLLGKFLNSLESKNPKYRKSIWLQGTYGTGKSHATGVVKHLLWDDLSEIDDFIRKIDNVQLRERLRNFRKENKVLPVTLKGVSGINSQKDFSLVIEQAVKNTLEKFNIPVTVDTEFDKYLKYIEDTKINWQDVVDRNPGLKSLVGDVNGLKRKLLQKDPAIITKIDEALGDLKISHPNIENWLSEVLRELKSIGITHMAIYWDEFTPLLELSVSPVLLNIVQSIAEKSFEEDIFLYIISHRHPQQTQISREDQEKVLGRFANVDYSMENITTFHIISNTIKKHKQDVWEKLRDDIYNRSPNLQRVTIKLVKDDLNLRRIIKDLFPIHPFTAELAAGLARFIGSTERSIFSFLYDENKGFINFIRNYPNEEKNEYFLTADKLWDYFIDDLERRQEEKIQNIVSKYFTHLESIQSKGEEYLAIFKGILLLNLFQAIITSVSDASVYTPKKENIEDMFEGTHYKSRLEQVLDYIDRNVIQKTPDGLYLILQTPLPPEEVNREKENAKREYADLTKLIDADEKDKFTKNFGANLTREFDLKIYWAGLSEYDISMKIRDFNNSFKTNIVLFLPKTKEEIPNAKTKIKKIIKETPRAQNVIFIVSHKDFGEQNYERLIEYIARKRVASSHSFDEEVKNNERYISKMMNLWLENAEKDYAEVLFRDREDRLHFSKLGEKIEKELVKTIFKSGLENIEVLTRNRNLWTFRHSTKYAEIFLAVENRDQLENELKNALEKPLLNIVRSQNGEYIVDKKLRFYRDFDPDHPTFKIFKEVENRIKEHEGKTFNLGDILEFLKEPPYGIYPNMVHYSLLGFVLRPYVNKLYESGTGRKITPILMKEKIKEVFNYLTTNRGKEKLEVRYGRQDEIELTEILKEIFRLEQVENLNQAKWGIREWIRKVNLPIWSLEGLLSGNVQLLNAIRGIDYLNKRVDKEITEELIKKILPYFKNFKTDLMLLLEREKVREGFKNWLLSEKNTVKINESEVDEVIEYLHKNMQEEVALWEKEKVLLKLKDWESEKTRERYKVEFINKLSSLFDLQRVNSIQELKDSVKNYINTNLKYPLWSIKYVLRVEDIIDFLEEFVRSYKDPSQEEIEKFLELLPSFENLLHKNLNSETAERGIQEWLKSRNSMCSINDINNFLDFIRGDIQKEPCFWEEKDLIKSLKKYNFLKQVAEIFNLEENYLKSTDDLRIKVKNRVAEMPYPFWAVGLVSDEEIKEAVHKLSEFIVSGKDDPVYFLQDLENLYQLIERNKDRIKSIWESSQVEKFYKYWVKKILNVNEDVSRILNAIKAKLKNEDYYWRKIEVENLILREKEIFLSILGKEMKEQVVQKVKTTNKDLRDILLKLVETYPQIISKLDELL